VTQQTDHLNTALTGRYRIERHLGEGGMASVYLCEDLKHDRKVALKLLKPELAAVLGADRFVVEIKTTASLQHPHILPLFDSGTADGFLFYVMPFIEGETLRDKLNRDTQLGVDDAVRIAREVLDALEYAHQHGIVHRDVKPENILLHGGHAMVADFGIALAVSAAAGGRMTETGLSLGTPHYMSPEQATAEKEITPRSDVYSLASVLYEMLAGQPPHIGGAAQQVIMKIITEQAQPVRQLRKNVPANVEAALAKALEKVPADRFESAAKFSEALRESHFTHGTAAAVAPLRPTTRLPGATLAAGAALAAAGLAFGAFGWMRGGSTEATPAVALTLELPNGRPDLGRFAVSQDGARFAFATDEGLAVRDSGKREYRLLPGFDGAESPSFSPDGNWLVFQVHGHLRKVPLTGGAAIAVVPNDSLLAGRVRWGQNGSIAFESGQHLYVVSPSGALRVLAKALGASPRLTPDGGGVLYVDTRSGSKLMYYDLAADTAFAVLDDAAEAEYIPSGHLVYAATGGGLFAIRFDRKRHAVSGNPIPIVADVQPNGGVSPFDVTRSGALMYRSGIEPDYRVLVRDAKGKVDTLPLAPKTMAYLRVSPDGRTLALTIGAARSINRYTALFDVALGGLTRFTQEGGGHAPVFSPDGKRLAFTADLPGGDAEDIFVQPVDRSTPAVRLFKMPSDQHASSWPVDTMLVFSSQSAPAAFGAVGGLAAGGAPATVHIANPATPGATPRTYLKAEWGQLDAEISPDGKWAAFTSLETGTPEIYVRRFPDANAAGVVKVSSGGGGRARWSGDGRTIYYAALDGKSIRAVHVTIGAAVTLGASETVMTAPGLGNGWDVDWKTGKIYVTQAVGGDPARIVVIQHWLEDFRRGQAAKR
jgi:eukaryotic-like serine/threonine-protein kinase